MDDQTKEGLEMSVTVEKGRWYPKMPPALSEDETDDHYTNRLLGVYGVDLMPYDHRRNRQCSIGWHNECSDPAGARCECPCHDEARSRPAA
jgi:hypothetical protein